MVNDSIIILACFTFTCKLMVCTYMLGLDYSLYETQFFPHLFVYEITIVLVLFPYLTYFIVLLRADKKKKKYTQNLLALQNCCKCFSMIL